MSSLLKVCCSQLTLTVCYVLQLIHQLLLRVSMYSYTHHRWHRYMQYPPIYISIYNELMARLLLV
jgi:hypothetical protein